LTLRRAQPQRSGHEGHRPAARTQEIGVDVTRREVVVYLEIFTSVKKMPQAIAKQTSAPISHNKRLAS
jgi:hypothetical protein